MKSVSKKVATLALSSVFSLFSIGCVEDSVATTTNLTAGNIVGDLRNGVHEVFYNAIHRKCTLIKDAKWSDGLAAQLGCTDMDDAERDEADEALAEGKGYKAVALVKEDDLLYKLRNGLSQLQFEGVAFTDRKARTCYVDKSQRAGEQKMAVGIGCTPSVY